MNALGISFFSEFACAITEYSSSSLKEALLVLGDRRHCNGTLLMTSVANKSYLYGLTIKDSPGITWFLT